jgi:short-subunit dehydrogenase
VLVNNAGYALLGAVEETTQAEMHAVFETDFFGAVRMTQAVLPTMRTQQKGTIIFMGVILGLIGQPFGAFLSSTKHALEGFGESLSYEVRPFGISVSLVEPSFVATNAHQALQQTVRQIDGYASMRQQASAKFLHDLQGGMMPEQVAQVVERIVDARSPRLRYPIGTQARLIPMMKQLIPQRMFMSVARRAYGL